MGLGGRSGGECPSKPGLGINLGFLGVGMSLGWSCWEGTGQGGGAGRGGGKAQWEQGSWAMPAPVPAVPGAGCVPGNGPWGCAARNALEIPFLPVLGISLSFLCCCAAETSPQGCWKKSISAHFSPFPLSWSFSRLLCPRSEHLQQHQGPDSPISRPCLRLPGRI